MKNGLSALIALLVLSGCGDSAPAPTAEETPAETGGGSTEEWEVLFDGTNLDSWIGFGKDHIPDSWRIEGDSLLFSQATERGDIMTRKSYRDFELELEWKISPGGNSGIFYRASTDQELAYLTAPEMQVLDNGGHQDGNRAETSAGSNYALHAPAEDVTRPVGEFNKVKIVVDGNHVEHWMNDRKLLEYELLSDEWEELVRASKFAEMPGYGRNSEGHILLQDHGNDVWFRNVRIRVIGHQ